MNQDVQKRTYAIEGPLNFDEVVDVNQVVDLGQYTARLTNVIPAISQKGNPMVSAHFTILPGNGKHEGLDAIKRFTLVATEMTDNKTGRKTLFCNAVSALRAAAHAVGAPFPKGFSIDGNPEIFARLIAEKLGKKELSILVHDVPNKKDDKVYRDVTILGLAGSKPAAAVTGVSVPAAATVVSPAAAQAVAAATGSDTRDPLAGLLS